MKTLLGLFTFLLLTVVPVLGQKYGNLEVGITENGHINVDYSQFRIFANGKQVGQTDSTGNFYPKSKIRGVVAITHPSCITQSFKVKLINRKSYEWKHLTIKQELIDSANAVWQKWLSIPYDSSGVSDTCDVEPEFPGGIHAMIRFIANNTRYPQTAMENEVMGKAYVCFVVNEDGSIRCGKIIRGFDKACDEEALRVISLLPNFTPAQLNGQPVAVEYMLPISFKLQ